MKASKFTAAQKAFIRKQGTLQSIPSSKAPSGQPLCGSLRNCQNEQQSSQVTGRHAFSGASPPAREPRVLQRKLAAAVGASVGGTRHGSCGMSPSRERGTSVFSRFVQQSLFTVQNFVYRKIDILEPVIGSRRTSQTAKNICCHVMFHELNLRICAECTGLTAR